MALVIADILLVSNFARKSVATLEVEDLSATRGVLFALKKAGIAWLIGLACIFIPVLHFFLVPLFLVIGLVVLYRNLGADKVLSGGMITCPDCQKQFEAPLTAGDWPFRVVCPHCQSRLRLDERTEKGTETTPQA